MKKKKTLPRFALLMLVGLFFFGFQQSVEAQMRVINNTGCNIAVIVAQTTNGTCPPCNPSAFTLIPPGGTFIHPAFDACGPELWEVVRYAVGPDFGIPPITSVGQTFNPSLNGVCGPDIPGFCTNPIMATWFFGGPGPQTVLLQ